MLSGDLLGPLLWGVCELSGTRNLGQLIPCSHWAKGLSYCVSDILSSALLMFSSQLWRCGSFLGPWVLVCSDSCTHIKHRDLDRFCKTSLPPSNFTPTSGSPCRICLSYFVLFSSLLPQMISSAVRIWEVFGIKDQIGTLFLSSYWGV